MWLFCGTCCVRRWCFVLFFFKHKTAYEMRISDWSSDVCSSDLQSDQRASTPHAKLVEQIGRCPAHSGDHLPAVAARCPPADPPGLDQNGRMAGFCRSQRRRKPGISAAHYHNIHRCLSRQRRVPRSEEHTSELQSLMRISSAV